MTQGEPSSKFAGRSTQAEAQARLLDLANDAIFVRDLGGRLRYWNLGAERLYQWTRQEALENTTQALLKTKYPTDLGQILQELSRTGTWSGELEQCRRDGTWVTVSSRWMLEEGAGGGQSSILQINTDITERRRAERGLRDSEARFRGLLESAPDATVIVGRDGRIALTNRRVEDVFGYTAEELQGQLVEILIPTRFNQLHTLHRESYNRHPQAREMGAGLDLLALRKDGSEFPVEISLSPLQVGEEFLVTAAIRDITRRKQAEADLRRLHTLQLAESEHLATLGEIAAGLAHEIKNPLAGIAGALEVLAGNSGNAEDKEIMDEVRQQVVRIRETITDLLSYARPRALRLRAGDLNATVEQVVHFAARRAQSRGIAVTFRAGSLPSVVHDADYVHRMVLNLLLNAVDAVPEQGTVEVFTELLESPQPAALIHVKDSGMGISPAELENIFRPFYTTKGGKGSGLGLPLCQRIAALHEGRIEVHSALGNGSTFTAVLPVRPPSALFEVRS